MRMSHRSEINDLILKKIERSEESSGIKEFLLEILRFEHRNSNLEKVRYSVDYMKLIERYSGKQGNDGK